MADIFERLLQECENFGFGAALEHLGYKRATWGQDPHGKVCCGFRQSCSPQMVCLLMADRIGGHIAHH